jgi:membrane associated rhomboid family serine protease
MDVDENEEIHEEKVELIGSPSLRPIPNVKIKPTNLAKVHYGDESSTVELRFTQPRDPENSIIQPDAHEIPSTFGHLTCINVRREDSFDTMSSPPTLQRGNLTPMTSPRMQHVSNNNEFRYSFESVTSSLQSSMSIYLKHHTQYGLIYGGFLIINHVFFTALERKNLLHSIVPSYGILRYRIISPYPQCADIREQVWRLFTYSIVHNGLLHVFLNMIGLMISSLIIEVTNSWHIGALLYITSIIQGAMTTAIAYPDVVLVGASAGVFGLVGGNTSDLLINMNIYSNATIIFRIVYILIFLVSEIISYTCFYEVNIAYVGHWSAYMCGLSIGLVIIKPIQERDYHKYMKYIGILTTLAIYGCMLFYYLQPFPLHGQYHLNLDKYPRDGCCTRHLVYGDEIAEYKQVCI